MKKHGNLPELMVLEAIFKEALILMWLPVKPPRPVLMSFSAEASGPRRE
jgi:hypothetical protein